jgi:hypothetical protein
MNSVMDKRHFALSENTVSAPARLNAEASASARNAQKPDGLD